MTTPPAGALRTTAQTALADATTGATIATADHTALADATALAEATGATAATADHTTETTAGATAPAGLAPRRRVVLGVWHRSNLVTHFGLVTAGLGLGLVLVNPGWSVVCLVVAGVSDLLDGAFARRFARDQTTRDFGVQLDSLADMVAFVALPAALLLALRPAWWAAGLVIALYATAAVVRLAFFNITTDGTPRAYRGLPVTYAALLLPLVWLATALLGVGPTIAVEVALAVLAVLFVVDVPWPKPRGAAYGVFLGLALLVGVGLVWTTAAA